MENIYNSGQYLNNNPSWHIEDSPWKAKQIMKCLARNQLHPKTVCEVGCGAGEILNQLHQMMPGNVIFYGYEKSCKAFQLCRERSKNRLRFFCQDITVEHSESYDLLLLIDVFEHVEDYLSFLRMIKTIGKLKIFHIPLEISVQTVLRAHMVNGRNKYGHLHYFSKETALATLEDTGYTVIDWFYTAEQLELPNRSLHSAILNIPRRLFFNLHQDMTVRILGGYSLMVLVQ